MPNISILPGKDLMQENKVMLKAAANGACMFFLSYLTVYLSGQVGTMVVAKGLFEISSVLHFEGVEFVLRGATWHPGNVVPVYLTAPAISFGLAVLSLVLLLRWEDNRTVWKQFLFWGFVHGTVLSLGTFISGAISNEGTYYALRWASFPEMGIWALAIAGGILLVVAGALSAVLIFMCCDSITLRKTSNRTSMLVGMLLLPWALGSVVVSGLKQPISTYDQLLLAGASLLLLLPLYLSGKSMLVNEMMRAPARTEVAWELVILAGVLAAVVLMVL